MTVVRALGVESEAELEFSALLEVCWPLLDRLDELPEHQADALRGARHRPGRGAGPLRRRRRHAQPARRRRRGDRCWSSSTTRSGSIARRRTRCSSRRGGSRPTARLLLSPPDGEERPFDAPGIERSPLKGSPARPRRPCRGRRRARRRSPTGSSSDRRQPARAVELPGLLSAEQLAGREPLDDPLPAGRAVERASRGAPRRSPRRRGGAARGRAVSRSTARADRGRAWRARPRAERARARGGRRARPARRRPGRVPASAGALGRLPRRAVRAARAHRALADLLGAGAAERARGTSRRALGPDEEAAARRWSRPRSMRGGEAATRGARLRSSGRAAQPDPGTVALERLAAAADAAWRARAHRGIGLVAESSPAADDDAHCEPDGLRLQGSIEFFAGNREAAAPCSRRRLLEGRTRARRSPPRPTRERADRVRNASGARDRGQARRSPRGRRRGRPRGDDALGYARSASPAATARPSRTSPRALELARGGHAPASSASGCRPRSAGWAVHEEAQRTCAATVDRARGSGASDRSAPLLAASAWQALHAAAGTRPTPTRARRSSSRRSSTSP